MIFVRRPQKYVYVVETFTIKQQKISKIHSIIAFRIPKSIYLYNKQSLCCKFQTKAKENIKTKFHSVLCCLELLVRQLVQRHIFKVVSFSCKTFFVSTSLIYCIFAKYSVCDDCQVKLTHIKLSFRYNNALALSINSNK